MSEDRDPTLPPLDSSAARREVRVTRSAPPPESAGVVDRAAPLEATRNVRGWMLGTFVVSTVAAGTAVGAGASAAILVAPLGLAWAAGALARRLAQAQTDPDASQGLATAKGREILARVVETRNTLEALQLNPEIHADLLTSLDNLPPRLEALDRAEVQCNAALEQARNANATAVEQERNALKDRLLQIQAQRSALGDAVDRLSLSIARIGTATSLDDALAETILAQAEAASSTADDLQ